MGVCVCEHKNMRYYVRFAHKIVLIRRSVDRGIKFCNMVSLGCALQSTRVHLDKCTDPRWCQSDSIIRSLCDVLQSDGDVKQKQRILFIEMKNENEYKKTHTHGAETECMWRGCSQKNLFVLIRARTRLIPRFQRKNAWELFSFPLLGVSLLPFNLVHYLFLSFRFAIFFSHHN